MLGFLGWLSYYTNMGESLVEVHEAVPRHESLACQLTELSWSYGVSNFFINAIPFSSACGHYYAIQLVNLHRFLCLKTHEKEVFHVFELGAGSGLLSKHFLDVLKGVDPDLYLKTRLHITDFSSALVEDMQHFGLFSDHEGQVEIHSLNAMDIQFPDSPTLVYFSHLVDSTPSRQLVYENGQIFEELISTSLPLDLSIVSAYDGLPKQLGTEDILKILESGDRDHIRYLAPRIIPHLRETQTRVLFSGNAFENGLLDLMIKQLKPSCSFGFQFHGPMLASIRSTLSQMGDETALVMCDFGLRGIDAALSAQDQVKRYGSVVFCATFFPVFSCLSGDKIMSRTTRFDGNPTTIAYYKGADSPGFESLFEACFEACKFDAVDEYVQAVETCPASDFQSVAVDGFKALNPVFKTHFSILNTAAGMAFIHGIYPLARTFSEQCLSLFGPIALPNYSILGLVYLSQGDVSMARKLFEKAIYYSHGTYPEGYYGLLNLAISEQDSERVLEMLAAFLKRTPHDHLMWGAVRLVVGYFEEIGDSEKVKNLVGLLGLEPRTNRL